MSSISFTMTYIPSLLLLFTLSIVSLLVFLTHNIVAQVGPTVCEGQCLKVSDVLSDYTMSSGLNMCAQHLPKSTYVYVLHMCVYEYWICLTLSDWLICTAVSQLIIRLMPPIFIITFSTIKIIFPRIPPVLIRGRILLVWEYLPHVIQKPM